jgi:hypothetical protein
MTSSSPGPLEKKHVAQGDTGEVFQAGSRLDGVIYFVLLLVDENVNRMLLLHKMLLCRSRRPLVVADRMYPQHQLKAQQLGSQLRRC